MKRNLSFGLALAVVMTAFAGGATAHDLDLVPDVDPMPVSPDGQLPSDDGPLPLPEPVPLPSWSDGAVPL
jgi:hypothetical protein